MTSYIVRRLLLFIPTLIIASGIAFFIIRLIPGSAIDIMESRMTRGGASATDRKVIAQMLGLDKPIWEQYGDWIWKIISRGDFGNRLWDKVPITEEILKRFPITFELGLVGVITGILIAFPIGIYSGLRQDTAGDYVGRSFAILAAAIPEFILGLIVVVLGSIYLNWSPSISVIPFTKDPLGNLEQFVIPGIVVGLAMGGFNIRMVRTMMLEVLRQDYIRTAWSKGLRERVVVMRHALRNALIPVVTMMGFQVPVVIGGTVIIEQIFTLPGIGRLTIEAALTRDYPTVSGTIFFFAAGVLVINLLTDLSYAYLDPRIRH